MISLLHPPRAHKSLPLDDAHSVPNHDSSTSTTRANLRSHSLPTPAPSPSPSLSSTSSAFSSPLSNMLALDDSGLARSLSPFAPAFNPVPSRLRAMQQYMPVTPDNSCLALPTLEYEQFDAFSISKSRVVRLSNFPLPSSPDDASTQALVSLFPLFFLHPSDSANGAAVDSPTPLRMWTVRPNAVAQDGERPIWAVFASHEEACAALRLSAYDIGSISITPALEAELEPFAKLQVFDLKMLCNSATPTNRSTSQSAAVMGMQSLMRYPPSPTSTNDTEAETEAELFFPDGQDEYEFAYGGAAYYGGNAQQGLGCGFRNADAVRELQTLQMMQACGYTLSSNPPKARTGSGFRHGDWICSVPVCAAHNFGRNVTCIQCSAPRPANYVGLGGGGGYVNLSFCSNGQLNARALPHAHAPGTARNASPRFANTMNAASSHGLGHGHGQAQAEAQAQSQARHAQQQQQQQQHPHPKSQVQQSQAQGQAQAHPLLTPSGRAFAVGGKVQNVSSDPLVPCIMFWPDNEALPDPGQIRPATLAAIPQPPIMNTGNKGPIEKQPGDWVCLKCDYLNWRRRKVCQTCYPYAEGNGDSVSATMHAERLAILTAVYGQSHSPQVNNAHAQTAPQFKNQAQNFSGSYQASIISTAAPSQGASSVLSNNINNKSMLSGYPFSTSSSSHRSEYLFGPGPAPVRRLSIPSLSVSTSVNNSRVASGPVGGMSQATQAAAARRAVSSPESAIGRPGSIVYQTPPSPAAARPPTSISSGLAALDPSPTRAGSLLPSFLKQEVHPQSLRGVSRPFTNTPSSGAGVGAGSRTPASLSPASSTSADLPVDEQDGPPRSVGVIGSGRSAGFYAHPRGAGSGSSMGSSSSLTLSGGSIWSIARNEDKAWSGGNALATVEALKGLTL